MRRPQTKECSRCRTVILPWTKRAVIGAGVTLASTFDPAAILLQGTPQDVADAARKNIDMGGQHFILQPGCEVPPGTPETNIRAFCPCQGCLIPELLRLSC